MKKIIQIGIKACIFNLAPVLTILTPAQAMSPCPIVEIENADGTIEHKETDCPPPIHPILLGFLITTFGPTTVTAELTEMTEDAARTRQNFIHANLLHLQRELIRQPLTAHHPTTQSEYLSALAALSTSSYATIVKQGQTCVEDNDCDLANTLLALP